MKNYLKFILSYLLIFVIMVTSFGITIHNHICGHSGKTNSTLFVESSCECDQHTVISHNKKDDNTASCYAVEQASVNNSTNLSLNGDSCCSNFTYTKSLNNIFLTQSINKIISVEENFNFIDKIEQEFNKQKNDLSSKFKSIKQKLKNFTSFSVKIISILNNFIQKDNTDDRQTA